MDFQVTATPPRLPEPILTMVAAATVSYASNDFNAWIELRRVSTQFKTTIEEAFLDRYMRRMSIPYDDKVTFRGGRSKHFTKKALFADFLQSDPNIMLFQDEREPEATAALEAEYGPSRSRVSPVVVLVSRCMMLTQRVSSISSWSDTGTRRFSAVRTRSCTRPYAFPPPTTRFSCGSFTTSP